MLVGRCIACLLLLVLVEALRLLLDGAVVLPMSTRLLSLLEQLGRLEFLSVFVRRHLVLHMHLMLALLKLFPQLLLQVLLDLALRHERQVMEGRGRYAHLLKLLLRVRLYRKRQRDDLSRVHIIVVRVQLQRVRLLFELPGIISLLIDLFGLA